MVTRNRVVWIISGELIALAILVALSEWRWGGVAWLIAFAFPAVLIAAVVWGRDRLVPILAVLGGGLILLAIAVAVAYHTRSTEQRETVASMKRISVALAEDARTHHGLYPDGARFVAVVQRIDAGVSLNDAWGHPFRYTAIDRIGLPTGLGAGPGFILQSAGANGILKPNYIGDVYNWPHRVLGLRNSGDDLLMINGVFLQAPRWAWQ